MRRRNFSREFKTEAVRLFTDRGVAVSHAARDLALSVSVAHAADEGNERSPGCCLFREWADACPSGRDRSPAERLSAAAPSIHATARGTGSGRRLSLKKGETIVRHWSKDSGRPYGAMF